MLAGCQARADDARKQNEAVYTAFASVMCAGTDEDRSAAIEVLADKIERYQPSDEDDSALSAVEAAALDYKPDDCAVN